jgi:hypothetical protein
VVETLPERPQAAMAALVAALAFVSIQPMVEQVIHRTLHHPKVIMEEVILLLPVTGLAVVAALLLSVQTAHQPHVEMAVTELHHQFLAEA